MNWFQRLRIRFVRRFFPELREALRASNFSIQRLADDVALYRERYREENEHQRAVAAEMQEAYSMFGPAPWLASNELPARESGSLAVAVKERIADLELGLEDRGWLRDTALSNQQFSRWGIQMLALQCRLYRIKNPIIQRGILVSSYYVFGRGFEVSSDDKATNDVIEAFFNDERNKKELSVLALMERECDTYTDGNIFWTLFVDASTGEVAVRTIDSLEIQMIVSDPNDSSIPMFYKRQWSEQVFDLASGNQKNVPRTAWYVDIDWQGTVPQSIGRDEVMRTAAGDPVRVLHRKDGSLPKWQFGVPRAYAAVDWARAYKNRLEDYASVARALARFAWDAKTKGGAPAIAGLKQTLATTLANDGTQIETNPPPVTASSYISGPGNTLTPFKTAGAQPSPEEGRRLLLMAIMVFGLPETFFGDVSVGTLATAQSLDRPTELKFKSDQEVWSAILKRMARFAVEQSSTRPKGQIREAGEKAVKDAQEASRDITVSWPAILEGDVPVMVGAIVDAITLKGKGKGIDLKTGIGLLLIQLGVEQPEAILDAMFPPATYEPERDEDDEMGAIQVDPNAVPPDPKAVDEALKEVQRWLAKRHDA